MELSFNDKVTADPSADDIRQAMAATPRDDDWYLTLEAEDESMIDVVVDTGGAFKVTASIGGRDLEAGGLDADQVKDVLLKFRARDASWAKAPFWKPERHKEAPAQ